MGIIKGLLGAAAFLAVGSLIASKTHVKTPKKILDKAKRRHGDCTFLSTEERDGKVYVTVRDRMQGFTYTLCSAMASMDCDGSTLFHYENTTDDFDQRLFQFTLDLIRPELEAVLAFYGASSDLRCFDDTLMQIIVREPACAAELALKCAGIWQQRNVNQRLDRKVIRVDAPERVHLGSVTLPELRFLDRDAEEIQWVMQHIRCLAERAEVCYLRTEFHTLAEIGCPPDRVSRTCGIAYPEKPEDPVKCFYFTVNGTEYFAANFFDNATGNLYTNFNK